MLAGYVVPVRPARVLLNRRDQFIDLIGALGAELDAARMAGHHPRLCGPSRHRPGQRHVDEDAGIVADHPRVVPRSGHQRVTRAGFCLGAVVHPHREPPGEDVAGVGDLQDSVPASGLTSTDQRQPGRSTARTIVVPASVTM